MGLTVAELLEQAEQLDREATPGPWHRGRAWDETEQAHVRPVVLEPLGSIGADEIPVTEADAEFIAAARTLVPELAARLRLAQNVVEALREQRAAKEDLERIEHTAFTEIMSERGIKPPPPDAPIEDRASFGTELYRPYRERVKAADSALEAALDASAAETGGSE